MRYLIAFAVIAAAVLGFFIWAAAEGYLDCPEGQHPEIVSYMTTTNMVGKTPVTNTTPIYACK